MSETRERIESNPRLHGHLQKNNTSFPVELTHLVRQIREKFRLLQSETKAADKEAAKDGMDRKLASILRYYQFLVRELMLSPEYGIGQPGNPRGFLIYHAMGTGKTMIAISIAMAMWNVRKPVLVLTKSLQESFSDDIRKLVGLLYPDQPSRKEAAIKKFTFISRDAPNMGEMLTQKLDNGLNDKLLIVDEAHNIFRSIINNPDENSNARKLYHQVMGARNLRIIFLSGTPASKHSFELVSCFNMLMGNAILPEHYDTFSDLFIDKSARTVKNRARLANRLFGMVSYISHEVPTEPGGSTRRLARVDRGFPEDLGTEVIDLEMSDEQYRIYLIARDKENMEGLADYAGVTAKGIEGLLLKRKGKGASKRDNSMSLPQSERENSSTYYVMSRQVGNFCPPEALRKRPHDKDVSAKLRIAERVQNLHSITPAMLTKERSPKADKMVELVRSSPGPVMVYSQFVGMGGLAVFEKYLLKAGFTEFKANQVCKVDGNPAAIKLPPPKLRFTSFKGEVPPKDRAIIRRAFNDPANARGETIKVFFVSKTGAEGIDLKCIRRVIIMEPYWDKSLEAQIRARAIRMASHDALPAAERDVKTYLLLAAPNKKIFDLIPEAEREKRTVDQWFHDRGIRQRTINDDFRQVLQSVSIECIANGYPGCHSCKPTNEALFLTSPILDLKSSDPCIAMAQTEIVPDGSFDFEGTTYFFKKNPPPEDEDFTDFEPLQIFRKDEKIGGLVFIAAEDTNYIEIIAAAMKAAGL